MKTLTPAQTKHLKGLAHELKAVVMIGDKGLTDNVVQEIKIALNAHELIKINIRADDKAAREAIIKRILKATAASKVQTIGGKLVIFKRSKEAKIAIPKG
ncbi:MAG: ribosome assembly RNA-binding protein YhbY [Enterobacterales bacterium]|nr:ribosome assembly RNA-binding protein YhbY [Enterobacterales bacterium]